MGAVVVLALVASLGFGLLLFWAVRAEGAAGERMTRSEAERVARRDTDDDRDGRRRR